MRPVKCTDVVAGQKRGALAIFTLQLETIKDFWKFYLLFNQLISPFSPHAYFFHICFLMLRFHYLVTRRTFQQRRTYRGKDVKWPFSVVLC